jgi:dipeptidase E
MKLYLSSFRMGNRPEQLLNLLGNQRKVAMIGNSCDFQDKDTRQQSMQDEIARLEAVGLQATELDLRDYFGGKTQSLKDELQKYDLLWVRGGNAFILRRAFHESGLDTFLSDLIQSEQIVYGGYSAGIDMLIPSLHGAELVDEPYVVPEEYPQQEIIWECLNLLPYAFAPHYKSDHPESADIENMIAYMIDNHMPFVALRDGEALVVDGPRQEVVS